MEATMPLLVYMPFILYSACLEMLLLGGELRTAKRTTEIEPE